MVMTLRKRRAPQSPPEPDSDSDTNKKVPKCSRVGGKKKKMRLPSYDSESELDSGESDSEGSGKENEDRMEYEKIREQRMRENRERMEKLGIFSLSSDFFSQKGSVKSNSRSKSKNLTVKRKRYPPLYPRSRKSDRLTNASRSDYIEMEGSLKDLGITIPNEWKTEVYTEEDEKLLGDCKEKWVLESDGFEEDGERVYDPFGIPCHQCRQKIMGKLTYCGKCRSPHGQLCGDCLYTRYGENVLEAVANPDWSCPVCRDICNCSRCRRTKGWEPFNMPHSKVVSSGFKSVAHYLIRTRRAGIAPDELKNIATVVEITAEESAKPQQNEGSDYSAESSEYDSDDSDSEDDWKGGKKKDQYVEGQFDSTEGSTEAAALTTDNVLYESTFQNLQSLVSCN